MIADGCLLFNEIDLLEIRLGELDEVVDLFVVVEADRTFAGRPKPFFFPEWRHRFRRWEPKLVYRQVRLRAGAPPVGEPERFRRERFQRDQVGFALASLASGPEDVAVVSDVDEIWRASRAGEIVAGVARAGLCAPVLRNYRGYVNNSSGRALNGVRWVGPVACPAAALAERRADELRRAIGAGGVLERERDGIAYVHDAGWHLSSLGGPEAFWIKAQNFSHVSDPDSVLDVPAAEEPVRVLTGPLTREECAASQRAYLAHATDPSFAPLAYDEFALEHDVPAVLARDRERYRRFFFFTDCSRR